jgi:glutamine synthetase
VQSQREYVLRQVEERGVRFVQLWFTDVLGTPKTVSITPAELENALDEGMTFDGSAIDGFSRVQESDVIAQPDPTTFQILPFRAGGSTLARVFCDVRNIDGTPFEGDPRHVLRRAVEQAYERGFSFYASPELEYFYFADPAADSGAGPGLAPVGGGPASFAALAGQPALVGASAPVGSPPWAGTPRPIDRGSYFELTVADLATDLRKKTVLTLEDMGIPVEYAQHEDAPGQHEIDLRYTDALTMADTVMTVRLVVKEIAQERGVQATFMPKPLAGVQGSGMHTHFSLFSEGRNAFYDAEDERGLSKVARQFIAGLLEHACEITAVTNQWVNSYKRLVAGYEAPVNVSWAYNNRSALVRLPIVKRGKTESTRVEYRAPDPACNPYLTFAVILAAGLRGVEKGYELPPEAAQNLFLLSEAELAAAGIRALPKTLDAALAAMERSELVASTLGEHVFEWFLRNKRSEWEEYNRQVTPYELARYLPAL